MGARDIIISDEGSVIFTEDMEAGGATGKQVALQGPSLVANNYTVKMPGAAGSGTQFVQAVTAGSVGSQITTLSFTDHTEVGMSGINVLERSVTGDGFTDNSVELRAAVTFTENSGTTQHASAPADGGAGVNERLIFPAGVYVAEVVNTFSASHDYWLEGASVGATKIKAVDNESLSIFDIRAERMVVIRNMTIEGNAMVEAMLKITDVPYIFIDNVEFKGGAKAINIPGSASKIISITNCRFVDWTVDAIGPIIDIDIDTATGCDVIFNNNHVEGGVPSGVNLGLGTVGLDISSDGAAKSARCFIRDNHFKELGRGTDGALKITHGHDSVIEGNVFSSNIGSPIQVDSSDRVRIAGNTISGESLKIKDSDRLYGIGVTSTTNSVTDIEITGNVVVGTDTINAGIAVTSGEEADFLQDVTISNNTIEGCSASLVLDHVKGKVDIVNNAIRGSLAGRESAYARSAVHIGNIAGDGQIKLAGNVFEGGATSGRAIHFDRSGSNQTDSDVHLLLENNYIGSMAQHADFNKTNAVDCALIFIKGHSQDPANPVLKTVHASGNRYDFTSSQSVAYGMHIDLVEGACTFDSILEFGAVSGSTAPDSTLAINRAILAAGEGGEVHIPAGTFNVDDYGSKRGLSTQLSGTALLYGIESQHDGQTWHGSGTINVTAAAVGAINVLDAHDRVTIRDINLEVVSASTKIALTVGTGTGFKADGCTISDFQGGIIVSGKQAKITNCHIADTLTTYAIQAPEASEDVLISNNTIVSADVGGADSGILSSGDGAVVSGNTITNADVGGIEIDSCDGAIVQGNNINMGTKTASGNAISVGTSSNVTVSGNTVISDGNYEANSQDVVLATVTYASVVGNTLDSKQIKLEVTGASNNLTIANNVLRLNTTPTDADQSGIVLGDSVNTVTISGNTITASAKDAARSNSGILLGSTDDVVISGNVVEKFVNGFKIGTSGTDNFLIGNKSMSNVTNDIVDGGTNTLKLGNSAGGSLTFDNINGEILRAGSTQTVLTLSGAVINVTGSFHSFTGSGALVLDTIKINGNTTRTADNSDQAAACSVYDGMLLYLYWLGDGTLEYTHMNESTANSRNLIRPRNDALDTAEAVDSATGSGETHQKADITHWRFEHSGGEGMWRMISHNKVT